MNYTAPQILSMLVSALGVLRQNEALSFSGDLYRNGFRPLDSKKEDCVVSFIVGDEGQVVQQGNCSVNIYVKDRKGTDGMFYENTDRLTALSEELRNVDRQLTAISPEFNWHHDGIITIEHEESIHQHFVSCMLAFNAKYRNRPAEFDTHPVNIDIDTEFIND